MKIPMRIKAEKFILKWIEENHEANVLDVQFIDGFAESTGAKVEIQMWGANKCKYATKMLSVLHKEGTLKRFSIGLGINWQPGFPRWTYSYTKCN